MFTIDTLVGKRFGMWLRSAHRFPSADRAQAEVLSLASAERRSGLTVLHRRVIRA